MTEAVGGLADKAKSGRAAVQSDNTQTLLQRLGPIFGEALTMKTVPGLQIAAYMTTSIFVAKGRLDDAAVNAFMQQTVHGWTSETVRAGLVCLTILAQFRSAKQTGKSVTKALMRVPSIGALLVEIGKERRVDKLANGLCLSLIERLAKKGDANGLSTITTILNGNILQAKQIAVVFKSILLSAHTLNDESDEDGALRRSVGSVLITLSQASGKTGDIIQSVIQDQRFDIEELEMKLDLSFRTRTLLDTAEDVSESQPTAAKPIDLAGSLEKLSVKSESLPTCLSAEKGELFNELSHVFFSIVSEQAKHGDLLAEFEQSSKLRKASALKDATYFGFFIQIWCGPYPALARAAALSMVKNVLKEDTSPNADPQWLLPYILVALADPSKRVRQAAVDLVAVMAARYTPGCSLKPIWGEGSLYKSKDIKSLSTEVATRLIHLQLLPTGEECVMDPERIAIAIKEAVEQGKYHGNSSAAFDKKDHMSSASRLSVLAFLSSHAVATPLLVVKTRLLSMLNEIRGVSSTTRTQLLLPALRWWSVLAPEESLSRCKTEQLDPSVVDAQFVDILVANDADGIEFVFDVLSNESVTQKEGLIKALFARMRKMWPQMKEDIQFSIAERLLDMSQQEGNAEADNQLVSIEAADLLRTVPLTTSVLSSYLDSIQTGTKMITEPPPNKRRRSSASAGDRSLIAQVTPELTQALRKVTFVLQLVDNSEPATHAELLDGLFTALSELQHFRTVVGSELGYLQNLILRSLLAMMPTYKENKSLKIDSSGGYGDLLVNCIQKSSSPVVQNAALLLIANLATIAPNLVLHSVMPIFTFMGTSVLRQSDDYSAHVVSQTVKEVVPPLIASLRKGSRNPITGASDILVSFTTAYEHIPPHRRQSLFHALVETLGPKEFLFAIVSMLIDRYEPTDDLLQFIVDLLDFFSVEVQLESLVKFVELTSDLFKPKPGISATLLGVTGEASDKRDAGKLALRQLVAFPSLITGRKLTTQISKLADRDDMQASEIRTLYSTLLENTLKLSETVKADKPLRNRCGAALANLLNLLSIGEFIKSVENLLDRPDMALRQKVLRALEARVETERNNDYDARMALLTFLPQLTAVIRESDDIRYKYTAVTCVDKIAEKYGKKDIEAVLAAAATIAGEHCLGQSDAQLRIMALLCLTSLVDVLQDAIVPVLPVAIPQTVSYLRMSVEEGTIDLELHSACYGFISSLAEQLPYMLSSYVDEILEISNLSASAVEVDDETKDNRVSCLEVLAKTLDGKDLFVSVAKNWQSASTCGPHAIAELLNILGVAVEKHSKPVIAKNSGVLADLFISAFDLRRRIAETSDEQEEIRNMVTSIEASVNESALKMIYKLNDAAFRPIFQQFIEWPGTGLAKSNTTGRACQRLSVYGFLESFFDNLKSIVTSYSTYVLEDAVNILKAAKPKTGDVELQLWNRVLSTLAKCFEHDQDDFWQAPAHFGAIEPVLMAQFLHAPHVNVEEVLIPATVELAAAADSQTHQKELNASLLKLLRSEQTAVRLAAVKCQQALTDRLGEEWLTMLHEMLPRIGELQDDDDEVVERETHRWIVKIEAVLGESLDSMLQ